MLSDLDWQKRGLVMDTKLYPNAAGIKLLPGSDKPKTDEQKYTHTPEDVRRGLMDSLKALKCTKVDMFYLHGPDRNTPFEDTLREVNALHKEGYFTRFGISNYMSWEVAKICEICDKHGWIKPTVYQGIYSALHRTIEAELFPCLRHYGISLYAFQPLAGGFLTGRYKRNQDNFEPGSRFDPRIGQGVLHRGRYWNDAYFDAMDVIHAAAEKHGLTDAEAALRWVEHHSLMREKLNDAIIVGASSTKHLEENLADLEKGPLPADVVEAMEMAWLKVKSVAPNYWH
jgi:aflatoxin B1 aldehyde reductase